MLSGGSSPDVRRTKRAVSANPSIKIVTAWFDLVDNAWSGVPAGLVTGLKELGVYGGRVDASASPRAVKVARRWLRATGRLDEEWLLTPEMIRLNGATNAIRRITRRNAADGYVQLGAFYGRPSRQPLVTLEDRTMAQLPWGKDRPPYSDRAMARLRRLQASLYGHATACCVASTWTKNSLVSDFGIATDKIHVVGYGSNMQLPSVDRHDWSKPRFLFVGRDWRRKNGEAVLKSFDRLRGEVPDAELDVVGDHPALARPGVTGHGHLDIRDVKARARLAALFTKATCFVLPSHEEPFGIAYIEAMSAGVPVIATSVGGPSDFVDESVGALVHPDDEGALSSSMLRLSDTNVARALGANARARSADYTWPKVTQRILASVDLLASPRETQ